MSAFIRQTISQKIDTYNGDKYLTKNDFGKIINKPEKPTTPEKVLLEDTNKTKKYIEEKAITRRLSYETVVLNKIFNLWVSDNINELEETFSQIVDIYYRNKAEFTIDTAILFKHFCREVFRSNKRELMRIYGNYF